MAKSNMVNSTTCVLCLVTLVLVIVVLVRQGQLRESFQNLEEEEAGDSTPDYMYNPNESLNRPREVPNASPNGTPPPAHMIAHKAVFAEQPGMTHYHGPAGMGPKAPNDSWRRYSNPN